MAHSKIPGPKGWIYQREISFEQYLDMPRRITSFFDVILNELYLMAGEQIDV